VLFRSGTFKQAYDLLAATFSFDFAAGAAVLTQTDIVVVLIVVVSTLITQGLLRNSSMGAAASRLPWWLITITLAMLIALMVGMSGQNRAFIYFQF
jgi:hypothetical protein